MLFRVIALIKRKSPAIARDAALAILITGSALGLTGCVTGTSIEDLTAVAETVLAESGGEILSTEDIALGLKEALSKGSRAVVGQVGAPDGFNADPVIRVPLPGALIRARNFASKVGLAGSFDDLETRLNRAAEKAAPQAQSLFLNAIKQMSLDDARGILQGPDDAATQYFEGKTGIRLAAAMRPLVEKSLSEVGAVNSFNQLLQTYRTIPLAPKVEADLTGHVVRKGMDGIFHYLAREEKAIRDNPLKRSSDLLRRVFAAQ